MGWGFDAAALAPPPLPAPILKSGRRVSDDGCHIVFSIGYEKTKQISGFSMRLLTLLQAPNGSEDRRCQLNWNLLVGRAVSGLMAGLLKERHRLLAP
jgi:hypothetical protein